jgi:GxxExxY protein
MSLGAPLYHELTESIIACAIAVHEATGPGLLESVYKTCLALELTANGLLVEVERKLLLTYRDEAIETYFKLDMIVEGLVIVETKAVERLLPVHTAQVITYLKMTGCPVGLLMNFNVPLLKSGIRRLEHPAVFKKRVTIPTSLRQSVDLNNM